MNSEHPLATSNARSQYISTFLNNDQPPEIKTGTHTRTALSFII
jgi:hypothetical protein